MVPRNRWYAGLMRALMRWLVLEVQARMRE
jgi:hypothetical protein